MTNNQSSNRGNPKILEYYQLLADIIAIFWQFHKTRILKDGVELAYMLNATNDHKNLLTKYDPQVKITQWRRHNNYRPHRVISDFWDGIGLSLTSSWHRFLEELELPHYEYFMKGCELGEESKNFCTSYVKELIEKADQIGKEVSQVPLRDGFSITDIIPAGINTGTEVTTQLAAIFGKDFNPLSAVVMSKVGIQGVDSARKGIGLTTNRGGIHEGEPSYTLLAPEGKHGLDHGKLRELGYGSVIGCPASMKPSKETREFLGKLGVDMSKPTMLQDFAEMIRDKFDEYLGDWFKGLSEKERSELVEPEDRRILKGERNPRREGMGRCPFGH